MQPQGDIFACRPASNVDTKTQIRIPISLKIRRPISLHEVERKSSHRVIYLLANLLSNTNTNAKKVTTQISRPYITTRCSERKSNHIAMIYLIADP